MASLLPCRNARLPRPRREVLIATDHLKGAARIAYDPGTGTLTHLLAVPLQDFELVDRQPRYEWWSADGKTRELVTIGGGVREVWATIRMDNEPTALKTLLRAAMHENVTVTYRETAVGTPYPCKVVTTDSGEVSLVPDQDRAGYGEWQVRVHLRRVDGGNFDSIVG